MREITSNMTTIRYKGRIKIFFVLVVMCVISVKAYDDLCADYLLSGWKSIEDSQIMFLKAHSHFEPSPNLRLYAANRWTTDIPREYYLLQLHFPTPKTLHTLVMLSPLGMIVRMYHYGISTVWQTVLFPETGDYLSHNSSAVPQFYPFAAEPTNVTYIHLYVWCLVQSVIPSLQVEILGCDTTTKVDMFAGEDMKSFKFVPLAVEDLPFGSILGDNVVMHMECGQLCFDQVSCVAFSSDAEVGQCIGYEKNVYGNFLQSKSQQQPLLERQSYYFYNYGQTRMLDYERHVSPILMYRVYTVRKTRIEAVRFCRNYSAGLLIISSIQQMTSVHNRINSSILLSHEGPYYVGGTYGSGSWQYGGNATIPHQLWSSSPNNTVGNCVVLTSDGLSSYQCDRELFFICAI